MSAVTVVKTPVCGWCNKSGMVELPYNRAEAERRLYIWQHKNVLLQDALPDVSAPLREQIKTGYHPECWDTMFDYDDDREEF